MKLSPIFIGIGLVLLLYLIWVTMSAIGLKGVTDAQQIQTIRQQAGLFLLSLFLALISLVLLAQFLLPVHPG